MSYLDLAVKFHKEYNEITAHDVTAGSLAFADLTEFYWMFDGECIRYHETNDPDLIFEGNAYMLETYRAAADESETYIKFYVDDGCGDQYDAVFDKTKRLEMW
ncbi:hypothetical protein [Citrobacter phage Tr1]|nr:hypothetical protein [Citrobacter phage Tr1]